MTRRFPSSRSGDDRFEELDNDPALAALVDDARARPVEADRSATLETALAVYRVAAAPPNARPAEPADRPTRRHRLVRALAATTLATKVLLGVGTAAALGGIGVAVAETVQHLSPPAPVTTTTPVTTPTPSQSPTGSPETGVPAPTGSTSTTPTSSPTSTVTDTASVGATSSTSPSGGSTGSGSPTTPKSSSSGADASPDASTPPASPDDDGER